MMKNASLSDSPHHFISDAVKALNPAINAVLSLCDAPEIQSSSSGPLQGEAIFVKDCIDIAGHRTTHGSAIHIADPVAVRDAEVVRRIRSAGAFIAGKAHLTEFCFGATGENVHFGDCRNPWDISRISGGSSSGSAAAVAAGIVRMAIGTDTGGSIRVPAALCGVVGLRPTLGRVSNGGVLSVSTICDTVGPIAATVAEAARLYAVMAGYDPDDLLSIPTEAFDPDRIEGHVSGMRIGMIRTPFFEDLQPDVASAVEKAVRQMERLGAKLVDVSLDVADELRTHRAFQFVLADVAEARQQVFQTDGDRMGAEVRRRIALGMQVSGVEYAACIRALQRLKRNLRRLFEESVDILLTPTTPVTAPLWEHARDMVATTKLVGRLTYDLGAAGIPSISVPCGHDGTGLPIGLQLSAAWGKEALLFQAATAFETATDHHRRFPKHHMRNCL